MLSMGFEEQMNEILSNVPRKGRLTMLFSATMTTKVEKLKRACCARDPANVSVSAHKFQTVSTLKQEMWLVPAVHKDVHAVYALSDIPYQSAIVFASTCKHVSQLASTLKNLGMKAVALHGQMPQANRFGALHAFKAGTHAILVATDVASRGLDIPNVDLVLNYDVPGNGKDYVHRVGRTARAGRAGRALTLVCQYDFVTFQKIEKSLGTRLDEYPGRKEEVLSLAERVNEAARLAAVEEATPNARPNADRAAAATSVVGGGSRQSLMGSAGR